MLNMETIIEIFTSRIKQKICFVLCCLCSTITFANSKKREKGKKGISLLQKQNRSYIYSQPNGCSRTAEVWTEGPREPPAEIHWETWEGGNWFGETTSYLAKLNHLELIWNTKPPCWQMEQEWGAQSCHRKWWIQVILMDDCNHTYGLLMDYCNQSQSSFKLSLRGFRCNFTVSVVQEAGKEDPGTDSVSPIPQWFSLLLKCL